MPFKSKAQRNWMFANNPAMARRWAKVTKSVNLPEKVKSERTGKKDERNSGNRKG